MKDDSKSLLMFLSFFLIRLFFFWKKFSKFFKRAEDDVFDERFDMFLQLI
jgi:hypothetical protein